MPGSVSAPPGGMPVSSDALVRGFARKEGEELREQCTVGVLIPCTSRGRPWRDIRESYLAKLTLPSLISVMSETERAQIHLHWWIGIGPGPEPIYTPEALRELFEAHHVPPEDLHIVDLSPYARRGDLSGFWNALAWRAYDAGDTYLLQVGDDVLYYRESTGWLSEAIARIYRNYGLGTSGAVSHATLIDLTQCLVGRLHMEIHGYFFPPFPNLGCDDWGSQLYQPAGLHAPIVEKRFFNLSGAPRYNDSRVHCYGNIAFRIGVSRTILKHWLESHPPLYLIVEGTAEQSERRFDPACMSEGYPRELIRVVDAKYPLTGRRLNRAVEKIKREVELANTAHARSAVVFISRSAAVYHPRRVVYTLEAMRETGLDVAGPRVIPIRRRPGDLDLEPLSMIGSENSVWLAGVAFTLQSSRYHAFAEKGRGAENFDSRQDFGNYNIAPLDGRRVVQWVEANVDQVSPSDPYLERFLRIENIFMQPCSPAEKEPPARPRTEDHVDAGAASGVASGVASAAAGAASAASAASCSPIAPSCST